MKANQYQQYQRDWYRLDNAAVIFSLITSPTLPTVFRVSMTLTQRINLKDLQQAIDRIMRRFPYFNVSLTKGLFWYYLERTDNTPKIERETRYPCSYLPVYAKDVLPFRVIAYHNRISIEFHHSITDGTGAKIFINSLVANYLDLPQKRIVQTDDIFHYQGDIDPEEYEDAYKKYYKKDYPKIETYSQAFQLPFKSDPNGKHFITTGVLDLESLKSLGKSKNLTITEVLVAIYLYSLQEVYYSLPEEQQSNRPIRVSVPVNLRNLLPSKTLRNFSLHVMAGIDPRLGRYSLSELFKIVFHSMRSEVTDKFIHTQIKRNVRGEMHPLMRITPRILKDTFGTYIYKRYGERQFTGSLTNIGLISLPPEMSQVVKRFEIVPSANQVRKVSVAVSGYNDKIYVNFGRLCRENDVERIFFTKLVELGINTKIETN